MGTLVMVRISKWNSRGAVKKFPSYLDRLSNLVDGLCQRQVVVQVSCDRVERVEVRRRSRRSIDDTRRQR